MWTVTAAARSPPARRPLPLALRAKTQIERRQSLAARVEAGAAARSPSAPTCVESGRRARGGREMTAGGLNRRRPEDGHLWGRQV